MTTDDQGALQNLSFGLTRGRAELQAAQLATLEPKEQRAAVARLWEAAHRDPTLRPFVVAIMTTLDRLINEPRKEDQ